MANEVFAEYVTSTAFNLNLSRNQILYLCRKADGCWKRSCKCDISTFVVAGGAMARRGLINYVDGGNPRVQLTEAGKLVHALMIEAGLCVHALPDEEHEDG